MTSRPLRRNRQHGAVLGPPARHSLERAGWRTTLEFQENHTRSLDGQLLRVESVWVAEAERADTMAVIASVSAADPATAWERLLDAVETGQAVRRPRIAAPRRTVA